MRRALSRLLGALPLGAAVLGGVSMLNVVAGFGREAVTAYYFGASAELDAFLVAFTLPRLLTLQAASITVSVLLPVYMGHRGAGRAGEARSLLGRWFRFSAWLFLGVAAFMTVAGDPLVSLMAPGLEPEQHRSAVRWLMELSPFLWLGATAGVFKVVLDAERAFTVPAAVPSIISLGGILGAVLMGPSLGVRALVFGLTLGALVSFVGQWWLVRRREPGWAAVSGRADLPLWTAGVMIVTSIVHQLHPLVDRAVASLLPAGSIASLNYANALVSLPQTVLAAAVATALFPTLVEGVVQDRAPAMRALAARWMGIMALVGLVPAALLWFAGEPIVRLIFERGRFDAAATAQTAGVLGVLSLQIAVWSCIVISTRLLLAQRQARAVTVAAVASLAIKVLANLLLVERFGLLGVAAGTVAAMSAALFLQLVFCYLPLGQRLAGAPSGDAAAPPGRPSRAADLYSGLRSRASLVVGHRLIGRRKGDRFLASFPRSGNTWLRTILTNVLQPDAHSDPDVFNRVIPGVSIRGAPAVRGAKSPRLIKTHSWFQAGMGRTVYVVRDGRDALVSLYHYSTFYSAVRHGHGRATGFEAFFNSYRRGAFGQTWEENVTSWLGEGRARLGDDLLVVRFEDLKAEPLAVARRICGFLAIAADETGLERAVTEARLENMRAIERQKLGASSDPRASFYRGGERGQWHDYLTEEMLRELRRSASRAMELAGYSWEAEPAPSTTPLAAPPR